MKRLTPMLPLTALLLAACGSTTTGTATTSSNSQSQHTASAKATGAQHGALTSSADSHFASGAWVAAQYVKGAYSLNWSHLFAKSNQYAEWAMMVKPYVTASLWHSIAADQQASIKQHGGNGSPVTRWVLLHRMDYVTILHSGVMAQAGVTPTSEVTQVTFVIHKTGLDFPVEETGPVEVVQFEMYKVDGKWLIAKQYASPVG